jgi:hypothetical protein
MRGSWRVSYSVIGDVASADPEAVEKPTGKSLSPEEPSPAPGTPARTALVVDPWSPGSPGSIMVATRLILSSTSGELIHADFRADGAEREKRQDLKIEVVTQLSLQPSLNRV